MRIPKLCKTKDGKAYATYPGTGGKRRKYFGRANTDEAEERYQTWVKQLLNGAPIPRPKASTVIELSAEYLRDCQGEWGKKSTEYSVIYHSIVTFCALVGDREAESIGPRALRTYYEFMLTQTYQRGRSKPKHYSRSYIKKGLDRIKRMFRWACAEEYLPAEHWLKLQAFELPKADRSKARQPEPVQPVPWVVVRATLPFLHEPIRTMVVVQFACGMRPQDVCNMRPKDIDRSGKVWIYEPAEHKNTHRGMRLLKAVPESIQSLLQSRLEGPPDQYLFQPDEAPQFNPRMEFKEKYATQSYHTAILRACKRAQRHHAPIPRWTPNQLRHGIASEIRQRYGMDASSQYLGHATPDTTAIYAHRSREAVTKVAADLDQDLLSEILPK